jgi:hypothetical protein
VRPADGQGRNEIAGAEQLGAHDIGDQQLAREHALNDQEPKVTGHDALQSGDVPRPNSQPMGSDHELSFRLLAARAAEQNAEVRIGVEQAGRLNGPRHGGSSQCIDSGKHGQAIPEYGRLSNRHSPGYPDCPTRRSIRPTGHPAAGSKRRSDPDVPNRVREADVLDTSGMAVTDHGRAARSSNGLVWQSPAGQVCEMRASAAPKGGSWRPRECPTAARTRGRGDGDDQSPTAQ